MTGASATLEHRLLDFWFWPPTHAKFGRVRGIWFDSTPDWDAAIRERFEADYHRAAAGAYDGLVTTATGALALVLLLDQIPRNLFRGRPAAYATDPQARAVAESALEQGLDRELLPVQRLFLALPHLHSEAMADQRRALCLYADLRPYPETRDLMAHAIEHFEIMARFGRFPHRNPILARASTREEKAYLAAEAPAFGARPPEDNIVSGDG